MTWHSFPKAYIFAINTFMISRFTRTNKLLPLQILWNLLFLPLIEMLHSFTRGHFEHFDCMVQRTSYCNNHVKKPATLSKSIPLTKSTIQSSVPSTENIWNKTLHALHYAFIRRRWHYRLPQERSQRNALWNTFSVGMQDSGLQNPGYSFQGATLKQSNASLMFLIWASICPIFWT